MKKMTKFALLMAGGMLLLFGHLVGGLLIGVAYMLHWATQVENLKEAVMKVIVSIYLITCIWVIPFSVWAFAQGGTIITLSSFLTAIGGYMVWLWLFAKIDDFILLQFGKGWRRLY